MAFLWPRLHLIGPGGGFEVSKEAVLEGTGTLVF